MNYFSLLSFAAALAVGIFLYHLITDKNWALAFDRAFFQFTALNLYWFFKG